MNVLILSASTGAGHMRASNALKSYIAKTEKDINVEVVDVFKYINPLLNKTVCKGYLYLATKIMLYVRIADIELKIARKTLYQI